MQREQTWYKGSVKGSSTDKGSDMRGEVGW